MKNWNLKTETQIKTPKYVSSFLEEIFKIYEKYDLSISHQDGHGAFIIENNNEFNKEWLSEAHLNIENNDSKKEKTLFSLQSNDFSF